METWSIDEHVKSKSMWWLICHFNFKTGKHSLFEIIKWHRNFYEHILFKRITGIRIFPVNCKMPSCTSHVFPVQFRFGSVFIFWGMRFVISRNLISLRAHGQMDRQFIHEETCMSDRWKVLQLWWVLNTHKFSWETMPHPSFWQHFRGSTISGIDEVSGNASRAINWSCHGAKQSWRLVSMCVFCTPAVVYTPEIAHGPKSRLTKIFTAALLPKTHRRNSLNVC